MPTCDTNALLASGKMFQMLGGGLSRVVKLELLKQYLLSLDPDSDTSVNGLLDRGKCFTCLTPGQQRIVKLMMLCELSGGSSAEAPPLPPVDSCSCSIPTLTNIEQTSDQAPYTIRLNWTFDPGECESGSIEIERNVNGGAYALWATVDFSVTEYNSSAGNPVGTDGQTIGFRIRFVTNTLTCQYSNELTIQLAPE